MMFELEKRYEELCVASDDNDIYFHLPVLRDLASRGERVVEFGTRRGYSTVALILSEAKVTTIDIAKWDNIDDLITRSRAFGYNVEFIQASSLEIEIDECDMIFIDTFHSATQLERELAKHADKAKKYIALHDTYTYWEVSEPAYEGMGEVACGRGLRYAIEPFLANNPEWKVMYKTDENNGLTVLERI